MNKPIIRWTIGDVHPLGFQILKHSINTMRKLYGDSFQYFVCCNNVDVKKLDFNAEIIDCSKDYKNSLPLSPTDSKWKLYPPRLDISTHEIVMDNDVVLHKKFPKFDEFLKDNNKILLCQGHGRQFGPFFDPKVIKGVSLNSGIYGMPPNFDLRQKIIDETKEINKWQSWWDDQGVLAAIFFKEEYIKISLTDVSICHTDYSVGKYGVHFCAANKGMSDNYYIYHKHKLL